MIFREHLRASRPDVLVCLNNWHTLLKKSQCGMTKGEISFGIVWANQVMLGLSAKSCRVEMDWIEQAHAELVKFILKSNTTSKHATVTSGMISSHANFT